MLDWNYEQRFVDLSMPTYVKKVLERYRHNAQRQKKIVPTNRPPDSTALRPKSYLKKIQVRP